MRLNKTFIRLLHIFGWLIVFHLYLGGLGDFILDTLQMFRTGEFVFDDAFLDIPLLLGWFYFNAECLIPKYFNKTNWKKYVLFILLLFVFLMIAVTLPIILIEEIEEEDFSLFEEILNIGLTNIFIWGLSSSLALSKIAFRNMQLKKEAEKQRIAAELKLLKAQINPHFLFNSLNTIYSLANDEKAFQTIDAVLKLSEMMRYILDEATQEKVQLKQELNFLQNFVDLQLLRLSGNVSVDFSIEGRDSEQEIAPLLLIVFVENTFKHGISYQNPHSITIRLKIDENKLWLKTQNAISTRKNIPSSKVGLENVKKRLAYLYAENYELNINNKEEIFEVELKLNLN